MSVRAFFFHLLAFEASRNDAPTLGCWYRPSPLITPRVRNQISPPVPLSSVQWTIDVLAAIMPKPFPKDDEIASVPYSSPLAVSDIHAGIERNSRWEGGRRGSRITRFFATRPAIDWKLGVSPITLKMKSIKRKCMFSLAEKKERKSQRTANCFAKNLLSIYRGTFSIFLKSVYSLKERGKLGIFRDSFCAWKYQGFLRSFIRIFFVTRF